MSAAQHDGSREINAAKHHLESAKKSADSFSKMALSAAQRTNAASDQLKADESHLKQVKALLKAAESRVQSSKSQLETAKAESDVAKAQAKLFRKEVADAESRLKEVEERWEVIDIENHVDLSSSSDEEASESSNDEGSSNDENEEIRSNVSRSSEDSNEEEENGNDEITPQHVDGPIVVTEFEVEGCLNIDINGTYRVQGTHPNYRRSNDKLVYAHVGIYGGRRGNLILKQNIVDSRGNCNWLIGIDSPGMVERLFCSPKFAYKRDFFPFKDWKRCNNGLLGENEPHLRIGPKSGLIGEEQVSFVKDVALGELENTQMIVQGCGDKCANGIYIMASSRDGLPTYVKNDFKISLKGENAREKRWVMSEAITLENGTTIYRYCHRSPNVRPWSNVTFKVPNTGWTGVDSASLRPPTHVFLVKTTHGGNNHKRRRQG